MRTQGDSIALTWSSTTTFDDWDVYEASTRTVRRPEYYASLPPTIAEVARNIVQASDNSTGHGRVGLAVYSSVAVYIGRALILKPSRTLRRLIATQTEQVEQEPHLAALEWIKEATGFTQQRIADLIGVSRQTIYLWERGEVIADTNRRRIFAVREVLLRAKKRYTARAQLVEWLDTPRGIDGRTPAQLLANGDIERARLLAIATPSAKLSPPPASVRQPVPRRFRTEGETRYEVLPPDQDDELLAQFGEPGGDQDD